MTCSGGARARPACLGRGGRGPINCVLSLHGQLHIHHCFSLSSLCYAMLESGDCKMLQVKQSVSTVKVTTGCLTKCKSAVVKVTSRQMSLLGEVTTGESLLLHMTITTHWVQSGNILKEHSLSDGLDSDIRLGIMCRMFDDRHLPFFAYKHRRVHRVIIPAQLFDGRRPKQM
jgi:hypothetical protein